MTSEGHHHGDRATETASPEHGSGSASGFGLFEAPSVPETFPTFTPSRQPDVSSPFPVFGEEQASADAPATGATPGGSFAGFPPDSADEPVYVPAPAVLPIPNPATDEEMASWSAYAQPARTATEEPQASWSAYSHTPPPADEPASWSPFGSPPAEQPEPAATSQTAWSGFTESQPVSAQPATTTSQTGWSGFTESQPVSAQPAASVEPQSWSAFANVPPYEPPAPSQPEPVAEPVRSAYDPAPESAVPSETRLSGETRVPGATLAGSWPAFAEPRATEPAEQWQPTPATSAADSWPAPAPSEQWQAVPPLTETRPADPEPVDQWQAAAPEPAPVAEIRPEPVSPAAWSPSATQWVEPPAEPVAQPEQPSTTQPATRASASVPVASRIAPPADTTGTANRPQPRVYGAARPAESAEATPVPQIEPIIPQQAASPAQEGTAKPVVARASVSVGRITPAEAGPVPASAATPGVYGRPQPTVYGSATTAPAQAAPVQAAPVQQSPQPTVYGRPATPEPADVSAGQSRPDAAPQQRGGMPPYGDLLSPATQATAPAATAPAQPALVPAQRAPLGQPEPAQDRFNNFKPTEEPPPPVRSSKVLLLVIGSCVALLGLALGTLYVVGNLVADTPQTFSVGQCVKQDGDAAVEAPCTEAGVFSVTQVVANRSDCPDQTQPTIKQDKDILCLKPAATP